MNTKEFLSVVCNEIKYKPASQIISDELEGHIEDLKNDNLCKGYTEEIAEEKAIEQMGDAKKIGKCMNKIHRPKLDWLTLAFVLFFTCFGEQFLVLFNLNEYWNYSASSYWAVHYRLVHIEIILGLLLCLFMFFYDYRKLYKYSKLLFIIATMLNIVAYFRGFRANGNVLSGLYPFIQTSPTVITIPLYIIAFAGFFKDINKERNLNSIPNRKESNYKIVKVVILSAISITTSLMINFVSGFIVTIVYLSISKTALIKRISLKNLYVFLGSIVTIFLLLSVIICIIPTQIKHSLDEYTSALWVGIDTIGEQRINFVRKNIFKEAKIIGNANLQEISLEDQYGYMNSIQDYFGTNDMFAFLGILSKYGWVATICFITIILLFNIKLILSTAKIKDEYGKLIMIGIASFYIIHTVCNLAMNFGLIGVAEFELPFISGGKSTFITNFLCITLFLSVYRRKDINYDEPEKLKLGAKIKAYVFEDIKEKKKGDGILDAYK